MDGEDADRLGRRDLIKGLGASATVAGLAAAAEARPADPVRIRRTAGRTDPHTSVTFAALVDTVVPHTPALADSIGQEHAPGGLAIGLDEFLVTYVNTLFQVGAPGIGHVGDGRLAEPVAGVLDAGAVELLARGMNEHPPGSHAPEGEDWSAGGPFAHLHRSDRVRAIALMDEEEKDFNTATLPGPVAESDAGIVGQLVVAFTAVVYYSEWGGYGDGQGLTAPPSDRQHANEQTAVQSWRQTGYPRVRDGYKALRGYAGQPDSSLGEGEVWKTIQADDGPSLQITLQSGHFEDNDDYDTSDYEEVVPESDGDSLLASDTIDPGVASGGPPPVEETDRPGSGGDG